MQHTNVKLPYTEHRLEFLFSASIHGDGYMVKHGRSGGYLGTIWHDAVGWWYWSTPDDSGAATSAACYSTPADAARALIDWLHKGNRVAYGMATW